jgi:hypothetical protein
MINFRRQAIMSQRYLKVPFIENKSNAYIKAIDSTENIYRVELIYDFYGYGNNNFLNGVSYQLYMYGNILRNNTIGWGFDIYKQVSSKPMKISLYYTDGKEYCTINNGSPITLTESHHRGSYLPFGLFSYIYPDNRVLLVRGRLYGCKMYDANNVIVKDFVPAIDLFLGKKGLLEVVEYKFYTSPNGVDFS